MTPRLAHLQQMQHFSLILPQIGVNLEWNRKKALQALQAFQAQAKKRS